MALRDLTSQELNEFASSNDSSLIDVDAPNNTVYDEKNDRTISLPQTLDADETQFVIDRDIDQKGPFFAQQPVDGLGLPPLALPDIPEPPNAIKGVANFFMSTPQIYGGLLKEQAELAKSEAAAGEGSDLSPFSILTGPMKSLRTVLNATKQTDKLELRANTIIERNQRYMADSGYTRPAEGGFDGFMFDIGQGSGSLFASLGIAYLTRSPKSAAVAFGAIQKSAVYQEARQAGVEPEKASDFSTLAGVTEATLEKIGLDHFMKGMKANTAVKRFISGAIVEGLQEGSQQAAEEAITTAGGIRQQDLQGATENILYSAFLGSVIGGPSNAVLGSFVEKEAKAAGMTEKQAARLRDYTVENVDAAREDMSEFIDKEVAPLAADDERAREFMTLMQRFGNGTPLDKELASLTPDERSVFDEYTNYFNKSVTDPSSVQAVEKDVFDRFTAAGLAKDEATGAAKLVGARADAAARALGIKPMDWLKRHNLRLEVKRTPEEAKEIYQEKLDLLRTAPEAAPAEESAFDEAEIAGTQTRLDNVRGNVREVSMKKPLIKWLRDRGGVRIGGTLAGELNHIGINNKTAPGLFKKATTGKGMFGPMGSDTAGDLDNIPAEEFNAAFGVVAEEDGNGYVDRDWLLEALRNEQHGIKLGESKATFDESFVQALDEVGLDYRTATAEEVLQALGTDADVLAAAKAMGETLTAQQTRQVLGILESNPEMTLEDAIDEWQERAAIMGERATLNQAAYHGSPHKFDKFTLDHIGNGEGAQAYGWGLYFAGNKKVAEWYRKKLSPTRVKGLFKSKPFNPDKDFKTKEAKTQYRMKADNGEAIAALEAYLEKVEEGFYKIDIPKTVRALKSDISVLKRLDRTVGQLYEVALPENEVLLDWDLPLSKQPQSVREALATLGHVVDEKKLEEYDDALLNALVSDDTAQLPAQPTDPTGEEIYGKITKYAAYNRSNLEEKYGDEVWGRADKLASMILNDAGIKGLKYFDGESRSKAEGNHNYVIFDDSAIQVVNTLYQDKEGNPKGNISFTPDETIIRLFEGADPSTILHELGHLFLRDMRRVANESDRPMVKRDYQLVKKWLGVKGDSFTEAQEEKFARGFEAWLREGKAPKEELNGVFARFKEWLTSIYQSARDLNVTINDEVRQVFDRMLGGDFARTEEQIAKRDAAKIEADYLRVAEPPPSSLPHDTGKIFRDVTNLGADAFVPVSTRLGNIDVKLKHAVRKFMFRTGLYSHQDRVAVEGFIEKVSDEMSDTDYRIFDLALKNRDTVKGDELIKKYGLEKEWEAVRTVLDDLYNQALDVGLDMGYVQDYFPRQVKRDMSLEYLGALRNEPGWSEIQHALEEADPNGDFTDEEKASFVNVYLRGFTSNRLNLTKPSFTKARVIDYVTPEFNRFYDDSMNTLIQYIGGLRHGIESRKLFGMSEKETNKNIGRYVLNLIEQGIIDAKQEKELTRILKAVVEPTGTRGAVSWAKNASYIYLMGNPISAITQIQDLGFSLAFNGYYRTAGSFLRSVVRNPLLRKEDIGIENILAEFEDNSRANNAVRKVFTLIGLSHIDNIGKETYMGAAYGRLRSTNRKDSVKWNENLRNIFGAEAAQVKKDLANKVMSENVKYLLFSELSDVQPISLAEMPIGYLRGGNGRVFYMLKTYTIKQIDIYRTKIYSEIASGEPKRMITGLQNLIRLAVSLMLMGMGSDALKDLILGRPIEIDDLISDNILKTMGITKYQIYKAKTDGIGETFFRTLFVPPLLQAPEDVGSDLYNIIIKGEPAKDAETLGKVPFVGKFYYWWWGAGREKIEKENG